MRNNDGNHIAPIIQNTECTKHSAAQDEPCWSFGDNYDLPAICGSRIKAYGFVGQISSSSLIRETPGRYPGRKFSSKDK